MSRDPSLRLTSKCVFAADEEPNDAHNIMEELQATTSDENKLEEMVRYSPRIEMDDPNCWGPSNGSYLKRCFTFLIFELWGLRKLRSIALH